MARPAKFTRDEILDAACAAVARYGRGATIAQVAEQIGAPTGSLYYRFSSREELMVSLWLRSIERLHVGFLAAAKMKDPQAALLGMVSYTVQYCDQYPAQAVAMTLYRHETLLESGPPTLKDRIRDLNDAAFDAVADLCARRYPDPTTRRLELVNTAIQRLPYGLLRPYIGSSVPEWMEESCLAGAAAILALGD